MSSAPVSVISDPDPLRRAGSDVARARRQLDLLGVAAIHAACTQLEIAVARLQPLTAGDGVSREVRRTAERCRATLCSHVLAAEDLEAAGVAPATIAQLLRRATDAFDLAAGVTTR